MRLAPYLSAYAQLTGSPLLQQSSADQASYPIGRAPLTPCISSDPCGAHHSFASSGRARLPGGAATDCRANVNVNVDLDLDLDLGPGPDPDKAIGAPPKVEMRYHYRRQPEELPRCYGHQPRPSSSSGASPLFRRQAE